MAEGILPALIQWFRASTTPASLCSSAGVCGSTLKDVAALNKPALRVRDTAQCAMCEFVVREVKTAINDPQTLERIKEVALQVCGTLPAELATSCSDFVNQYEPMIANLVETLDPEMVCGMLGVCVEALVAVPPPPLPAALVKALASSQLLRHPPPPPVLAALAFLGLPPPHGPPHGAGMMGPGLMGPMGFSNDACDYCKMAVIEAHSLISNPAIQAEVMNYTKAVCDSFQAFAEPCKAYVDMYAPLVFTMLEQYLIPDAVCAQTGMCPPPPHGGDRPAHGPGGGFTCWLADSWLGDLMRKLGLGGLLPHHDQHGPGHEQEAVRMLPLGRPEQEMLPVQ